MKYYNCKRIKRISQNQTKHLYFMIDDNYDYNYN